VSVEGGNLRIATRGELIRVSCLLCRSVLRQGAYEVTLSGLVNLMRIHKESCRGSDVETTPETATA
jgi:hypothetical protein